MEATLPTSLLLLCAGATPASRSGGFAAPDDALDPGGLRAVTALQIPARFRLTVQSSSWRAARQTAAAISALASPDAATASGSTIDPEPVPALADLDHGAWSGRSFEDVAATDPAGLAAWLRDPAAGTPDGETLEQACRRIGPWLDDIAGTSNAVCAVTHPMMVRAALVHTIGFPPQTTLAIDLAPLSATLLSFNGRWRLQSLGAS